MPASELHADTIAEENAASNPTSSSDQISFGGDGTEFQLVSDTGEVIMRTNRETIDDSARQTLTMEEIETLKKEGTNAGKEIIAKLMASHLGIEQKTAFSLAKYKLLKTKKYLRRFTILPVDARGLGEWMVREKDASKVLEMREELLSLVGSWSNVHFAQEPENDPGSQRGRWLVVDETGGLLVATMAERMGILYPPEDEDEVASQPQGDDERTQHHNDSPLATSNTLTLLHTNAQPNLSLLKYFSYDPTSLTASANHPLSTHLLPVSWLQLLSPELDTTYSTAMPPLSPDSLSALKSGKRGTYYRKLRRHNRIKAIVDTTHAGQFDGLAIASHMDPVSILRHTIPLLRGGAPIAIYSPTIEPLVTLSDIYSTSRRTAFIQQPPQEFEDSPKQEKASWKGNEDFPLNPTLLLNTNVQSARVREWQVLPGRTHPLMTGRGGAEGYLFTGVRVVPAQGRVEARGKFARKRAAELVVGNDSSKSEFAAPPAKKEKIEGEDKTEAHAAEKDVEMSES